MNGYVPHKKKKSKSVRWWPISYLFKARIAVGTKLLLKLVLLHIGHLYLRPDGRGMKYRWSGWSGTFRIMCAFRIVSEVTQSDNLIVRIPIILAKLSIFESLFLLTTVSIWKKQMAPYIRTGSIILRYRRRRRRGWTDSCLSLQRTVSPCLQLL